MFDIVLVQQNNHLKSWPEQQHEAYLLILLFPFKIELKSA